MQPDEGSFPHQPESPAEPLPAAPDRGAGRYVTWSLVDVLFGTVAIVVLIFLLSVVIVGPVVLLTDEDAPEALFANAVANIVWNASMVAVVYWIARRRGGHWASIGFRTPNAERMLTSGLFRPVSWCLSRVGVTVPARPLVALAAFVPVCWLASNLSVVIYNGIVSLIGLEFLEPDAQLPEDVFDTAYVLAAMGVGIVVAAPIAEEVFFRGFLFAGLRRRLIFLLGGVISGFIFSLAHAQLGLIIPFTLVGLVLAYAYERADSLYAPIGMHFVFNCISFLALLFVPEARGS